MIARKDYMSNSRILHHEYYSQFVTDKITDLVLKKFTHEKLKMAFGEDKNFNTIPLRLWDSVVRVNLRHDISLRLKLESYGDGFSLSSGVCILKAAGRQIVEGEK